jgi:hypothetical membrane protein
MDATTLLVAAGAAAAVQFTLVWVVEGQRRDGFRPSYHPISALSLGPGGRIQAASFVVSGGLLLVFAAGVRAVSGGAAVSALLALAGLGLIGAGVFPMDAMRGYPPGAIDQDPDRHSWQHRWHDLASIAVFLAIPAAAVVSAVTGQGWWRWYSAATAVVGLGLFGWFGVAYERDTPRSGLIQRGMVLVIWAWVAVLSARLV